MIRNNLLLAALAIVCCTQAVRAGELFSFADPSCGCATDSCGACTDPCLFGNCCGDDCGDCGQGCGSCGSCDVCSSCCCSDGGLLGFGMIQPSERCFDDFISPMINFVHFEDPRTLTELRPIFVNHWVPSNIGNNVPAGGEIQLIACEIRFALTDRLSVIATKDGYIFDNTEGALDTLLDDGWADLNLGLKYNLLRDPCNGTIVSAGMFYELPIGSRDALQSTGDGEFHFFLTGGQRLLGGDAHILSSLSYIQPLDSSVQTSSFHWSNHIDYRLTCKLYVFTEMAWFHWTDDASQGLPLGVGGQDLFNLPATNVAGNDLVTQNVGARYKLNRNVITGIAYEFPLTSFKDVIDSRLMVDLILRY